MILLRTPRAVIRPVLLKVVTLAILTVNARPHHHNMLSYIGS